MAACAPTRSLFVLVGALLLVQCEGCGSEGGRPPALSGQVAVPAGIPAAELPDPDSRGGRLVARYCSSCHGVPSPRSHSADDWRTTTRRMFLRMEHRTAMGGGRIGGGGMMGGRGRIRIPSPREREEILAYLQAHALPAVPPSAVPEAGSEAAELFTRSCSRCHAVPDPSQHAPEEWPTVVERMRGHMREQQVGDLSDREAQAIVDYLKRASRGGRG